MNKILLLSLLTAILTGCQVSIVRPPSGDVAGSINVYQGFSRSAVGAQNTVDAASSVLAADVSSEINPALDSKYGLTLASEMNPEVSAKIDAEVSELYSAPTNEAQEDTE